MSVEFQVNRDEALDAPRALTTWYKEHARALPWRATRDPYAILVSETMLQQTRVDTVIPYYHAFLETFPTWDALANANEDTVLKQWQGLGYYSRARNLQRAAQVVAERYDGVLPLTEEAVRDLPGVGPYTTGAVLSIAYDLPVPAVDGNVLRVMTRYLAISEAIDKPSVKAAVTEVVAQWLQVSLPSQLTQALMELGALICTPRNPQCDSCPLRSSCSALEKHIVDELPIRPQKRPRKLVDVGALWLESSDGLAMEQRDEEGLLANLWQLPAVEVPRGAGSSQDEENVDGPGNSRLDTLVAAIHQRFPGLRDFTEAGGEFAVVTTERHIFTHIEWQVHVLRPIGLVNILGTRSIIGVDNRIRFVPHDAVMELALPRVYEKLLGRMLLSQSGGQRLLPL